MEPITNLMLKLQNLCKEKLQIEVNLKELPKENGVYAEVGPAKEQVYIRAGKKCDVPVLFMCKMKKESACIESLSKIIRCLKENRRCLSGESYAVCVVKVESTPHKTGNTTDGQAVYSCIVNFDIRYM